MRKHEVLNEFCVISERHMDHTVVCRNTGAITDLAFQIGMNWQQFAITEIAYSEF